MVVSGYIECAACHHRYLARIGMGSETYQVHNFDCRNCTLPITIGLRKVAHGGRIEGEENARILQGASAEATVMNLHASFSFDAATIHDRYAFPSILFTQKILPFVRQTPNSKVQDLALLFEVPNSRQLWGVVRNALTLAKHDANDRKLVRLMEDYRRQREKCVGYVAVSNPRELIHNFFDAMFYPRFGALIEPARALISKLETSAPSELEHLVSYYKANHWEESYSRNISLLSDYFRAFTELSQMLTHARINDQDVSAKLVGSKNFEHTKLFYGQAFETLTSGFVFLACLNNILSGRPFDQFQHMTLKKYVHDIEKAKRANPFKDQPELSRFAEHLDSSLRNGSHHASIWRDGETVFYRSGGTGAQRNMPYAEYLHLCNELAISCTALFVLEYELMAK